MNELIILGVMLAIFATAIVFYAIVGIVYYKLVLHSKKSCWRIIDEL